MRKKQIDINSAAQALGKRGGQAAFKKLGSEGMRELSKKAAVVREQKRQERLRMPVKNQDEPELNCLQCGYDHAFKTDLNKHNYCEKCNPTEERICPQDGFKYSNGGKCPCWR